MTAPIDSLQSELRGAGYVADSTIAATLHLAGVLQRPVLLEGEAGVGKTAVAHALARIRGTELIRLQCYEGIDLATAAYEWNYTRQLLNIKLSEAQGTQMAESDIFCEDFLLERPLLKAIRADGPAVLLIDEVDRADEAFEAFLLEVLSEFSISVPELGTLRARQIPAVILTSNATRELSDALRRRCLYHYIDYPSLEKEAHILNAHLPDFEQRLLMQIARFVQGLRGLDIQKRPGVAETLDWAAALCNLQVDDLADARERVEQTLGCLLKTSDDLESVGSAQIDELLAASV
ncbi:MAG: MoxR family ATPase [Pseudomonadota bacterium]